MPSGGARARSGPAPDPNALRRDRKDDAAWVTLPAEGYTGGVPDFPLPRAIQFAHFFEKSKRVDVPDEVETAAVWDAELELWAELWRKPQAVMWKKLGLEFEVASYVRGFLESVKAEASAGLKTAVLRMSGEIGLSLPGMHQLRWKLSTDELAEKRSEKSDVPSSAASVQARLGAVSGVR